MRPSLAPLLLWSLLPCVLGAESFPSCDSCPEPRPRGAFIWNPHPATYYSKDSYVGEGVDACPRDGDECGPSRSYCCSRHHTNDCDLRSVGCTDACCSKRMEEDQPFWDGVQEKVARKFYERVGKLVLGGCGFLCQGFIDWIFHLAARPPALRWSVDCWRLPNSTSSSLSSVDGSVGNSSTAARTNVFEGTDPSFSGRAVDNLLLATESDLAALELRKKQCNDFFEYRRTHPNRVKSGSSCYVGGDKKANLESAFALKVRIPSKHEDFIDPNVPGSVHWFQHFAYQVHREASGCDECCACSLYKEACVEPCLNDQRHGVEVNHHIAGYMWPDWTYDREKHATERFWFYSLALGQYYDEPLIFEEVDFERADATGEGVREFPLDSSKKYDGIEVGCHFYPYPWSDSAARPTGATSRVVWFSGVCAQLLVAVWAIH